MSDILPSKTGVSRPGGPRGFYAFKITDAQYIERMKARVVIDANGCWIWQGFTHKAPRQYGEMSYRNKTWRTHRLSYHLHKGPVRPDQVVCHTCDNQRCCNPDHLFAGTQRDNLIDSIEKKRHRCAGATHCPRGHEYDERNTYIQKNGARNCKACARARQRIAKGWPEDLAYSAQRVPFGYSREVLV